MPEPITKCFARYKAKLANKMWAVSALAEDGALVVSCWDSYFSRPDGETMRYTDRLSRWEGNALGNDLLRTHIVKAVDGELPVRLVIATTDHVAHIDTGSDASQVAKSFHAKTDVVGKVASFDGDEFVIDFRFD